MGLFTGRPRGSWREPSSPLHPPRTRDPAGSRQLFPGPEQRGGLCPFRRKSYQKVCRDPLLFLPKSPVQPHVHQAEGQGTPSLRQEVRPSPGTCRGTEEKQGGPGIARPTLPRLCGPAGSPVKTRSPLRQEAIRTEEGFRQL